MKIFKLLFILCLLSALGGCAIVPADGYYYDNDRVVYTRVGFYSYPYSYYPYYYYPYYSSYPFYYSSYPFYYRQHTWRGGKHHRYHH